MYVFFILVLIALLAICAFYYIGRAILYTGYNVSIII